MVFRKSVRVFQLDKDQYGRVVGRIWTYELDVNAELVRQGAAWVYPKRAKDRELYRLEKEAREAKHGLWALPEAQRMPPWEWRRQERSRR